MKKLLKYLVFLLIVMISGCSVALMENIKVSSLMQKKKHHEVINILQPKLERDRNLPSFELFLLSAAYYEVRDYTKASITTDLMEKQIAAGDRAYYGGDIAAYPHILRGYIDIDQGEYTKAIQEASEAYILLDQGNRTNNFYQSQLIDISCVLGVGYALLGNNPEVERCLATLRNVNTTGTILAPEKFIAIARIYMAQKRFDRALEAIQNPDAKLVGVAALSTAFYDQTFQELPKYFILTKCLYETGKLREAGEKYDELLKHAQIEQIGGIYWPVLLDRARIARSDGQKAIAETLLKKAVEVIEAQRSSIHSEAGRIGYVGDKQAVYEELVALLVGEGRPAEAFEYVERAKGRALVDILASQKNIAGHTGKAGQVGATLQQLAKTEGKLNVLAEPGTKQDASRQRGIAIALKRDLAAEAPELSSLITVTGSSVREIQDLLAEGETLLEYYTADKDLFAFILSRDGITVNKLAPFDVAGIVQAFRNALTDPASGAYARYARELYAALIQPVSGLLKTKRLTIVPHGVLHYLPFGALSKGDAYLIDRYDIRLLPNASTLKFLKGKAREGRRNILILGNPNLGDPKYDLKYAQEEALAIAKLVPQARVLLRDEAKAAFIQKNGEQFAMIHFAAHALFDPDQPLHSALLLAKDRDSDGLLRAQDLYALNLDADLVTLSACETALGKVSKGDDVVGFTRGFLYAGTRSIISSLWKVDDEATRDLMVDFYRRLLEVDKDEALRQAQVQTKKKYPHPYYWASFQLTGRAD